MFLLFVYEYVYVYMNVTQITSHVSYRLVGEPVISRKELYLLAHSVLAGALICDLKSKPVCWIFFFLFFAFCFGFVVMYLVNR